MRDKDRKTLWGKSGNVCSFPKCGVELAPDQQGSKVIGQEAHIKGEKPGTARYDPEQSDEDRDGYENRILLCPNHHTEIDAYEEKWTVDLLHAIKALHEEQVRKNRQFPEMLGQLKLLVQQYEGPNESQSFLPGTTASSSKGISVVRVDASRPSG